MGLLGGCLPWWVFARRVSCDCSGAAWSSERLALALAPFGLMGVLRLSWRCLVWRAPCACPGACLLAELWRELAPVGCLRSALRLPWRRLVWRVSCVCLGAVWPSERLALALAPVCLASCEVLACDSYLVRQGRGLPYKTGSVKDWFGKTRFSRTNQIRRRISLAQ